MDIELGGEGLLVVDIGDSETLDVLQHEGFVSTVTSDGTLRLGGSTDGCVGPWPGDRGETMSIRYGSFDLAGNFSGWTEPTTVTMPKVPATCSCNCSSTNASSAFPIFLVIFSFYFVSRRRKAPAIVIRG